MIQSKDKLHPRQYGLLRSCHMKRRPTKRKLHICYRVFFSPSCWRQKIKSAWVYWPSYFPPQGPAESHSTNPEISTNLLLDKTLQLTFSLWARLPLYLLCQNDGVETDSCLLWQIHTQTFLFTPSIVPNTRCESVCSFVVITASRQRHDDQNTTYYDMSHVFVIYTHLVLA